MTDMKSICIIVMAVSLFFLGCVEQEPVGTPVPTPTPTPTATEVPLPTVVPTTPQPTPTPVRTHALYISYVDDDYGFFSVITTNGSSSYANRTLTINPGDTLKWVSATRNNYSLTIVSGEGLWNNSSSRLRYERSYFNYTFTQPGNYSIYVKEFPGLTHQKIVVNP